MGMGIVSDKDFDNEKNKLTLSNIKTKGRIEVDLTKNVPDIKVIEKGRGIGNMEVPEVLRKVIGEESVTNGRASALELGKQFGISPSSVSAYTKGATSTSSYHEPDENLVEHIDGVKERISKKARNKLFLALHHMTAEKMEQSKATECSIIAKNMSTIIRDMSPESQQSNGLTGGPTFVFYAPQPIKEEVLDVIYTKE